MYETPDPIPPDPAEPDDDDQPEAPDDEPGTGPEAR
jgi:hypothetical protein